MGNGWNDLRGAVMVVEGLGGANGWYDLRGAMMVVEGFGGANGWNGLRGAIDYNFTNFIAIDCK